MTPSVLRFGVFELDAASLELRRSGRQVPLPPQPAKLLWLLADNAGALVTREQIRDALWPGETVVDFDQGINSCLRQVRQALGDSADKPRFVQTVPRRGYRFLADVTRPDATVTPPKSRRPVAILAAAILLAAVAILSLFTDHEEAPVATVPDGRIRLAVLPFENFMGDASQEYVGDGLTEEMIAHLARLDPQRLAVIARTSVMGFKGGGTPVSDIGQQLDVDYVLEGSVRKHEETFRVTAQLIQVSDESHLWVDSFESELDDLIVVQGDIAARISRSLELELLHPDRAVRRRAATSVAAAYDYYLRGRHHWHRFDGEGMKMALRHFDQAIGLDAKFARAWAAKADVYNMMPFYDAMTPDEAYPLAKSCAETALLIDPQEAMAHNALGFALTYYDRDWTEADAHFRRALELDPAYAMAHHWYAGVLSATGRHDEAIAQVILAETLDPLSLSVRSDLAWYYAYADRWDQAVDAALRTLEVEPGYGWARGALIQAYLKLGRFEDAAAQVMFAVERNETPGEMADELRHTPAERVFVQSLQQRLELSPSFTQQLQGNCYFFASLHAQVGQADAAIELLEAAFDQNDGWCIFLGVDPQFDALRDDPRFAALLQRLGLVSS